MKSLLEKISQKLWDRKTRRALSGLVSMAAAIVVFVTTYALVLPAITLEKQARCGSEEHQHDDSCYEMQLICGQEESEEHQHTQECYARVLVCGKEEHVHSTACYHTGNEESEAEESAVAASTGGTASEPAASAGGTSAEADSFTDAGSGNAEEGAAGTVDDGFTDAEETISFEDSVVVAAGSLSTDTAETAGSIEDRTRITVHADADRDAFPEGTTMVLSAVADDRMEAVADAVEGAVSETAASNHTRGFHAVDISFRDQDGNEIEPAKPIRVTMSSDAIRRAVEDESTAPLVVHVEDGDAADPASVSAATVIDAKPVASADEDEKNDNQTDTNHDQNEKNGVEGALEFSAGSFSVYAIVYTVDFEYSVNGRMYQFSLPGGGFVSLTDLIEVLGIIGDTNVEENEAEMDAADVQDTNGMLDVEASDAAKKFVADVESVECRVLQSGAGMGRKG